MTFVNFYFIH